MQSIIYREERECPECGVGERLSHHVYDDLSRRVNITESHGSQVTMTSLLLA
ncbi:hypothetical protein BDV39DRAFT_170553 [Aspergillus sergii]|uniref:Uncharacterized protein n=1 Tax=Aspergillus sergii TaxID=1034303 RepID=A0A5N6XBQ9_9EURO|nr:hypothetical protein BDV39DRAFT_170553 [Aspergillus sergii]